MAKKRFDREERRKMLLGDVGYQWQLRRSLEQSKVSGGLGSSAHADLSAAVQCILVGLDDAADALVAKAHSWAKEALGSEFEAPGWLAFETLALSTWLLENCHDTELYAKYLRAQDLALSDRSARNDPVNVSLALPGYLDAGSYERVLEIFRDTPRLSETENLRRIRNEAQLCFVIATHRLERGYAEPEVADAATRFLKKSMDKWLGDGHAVRAAEWMKIVHWNGMEGQLSAEDAVLKCYDYL